MDFTIKLNKLKTIDKIEGYWRSEDYRQLLELFDFNDAGSIPEAELKEMLFMAISDFEPEQAAEIVLTYKLGGDLKTGQIRSLSYEMLEDKVAEEYPDPALHYPLFNINSLLYEAYNGKFPKTLASQLELELSFKGSVKVTKEIVLRTLSDLLSESSVLKRLFNEQLDADTELKDAEGIIWELHAGETNKYQVISSDYWFNREDFVRDTYNGTLGDEEINHRR